MRYSQAVLEWSLVTQTKPFASIVSSKPNFIKIISYCLKSYKIKPKRLISERFLNLTFLENLRKKKLIINVCSLFANQIFFN